MNLETYLSTLDLQIDRMVPFEELPNPIMRKLLSKYPVGFDNCYGFTLTQRVELSKFERYGIAPPETALYLTLIDPIRRCYIITKAALPKDTQNLYR